MKTNYLYQATPADYPGILSVWEASVRATHSFLTEEDILCFKSALPTVFPEIDIRCLRNENNKIIAFIGTKKNHIEMLFIEPGERGKGTGKELIAFAVSYLQADSVDVNEQNEQAVGFYKKTGFTIISRDERDATGKPYPILHMKRILSREVFTSSLLPVEKHPLGFFLPPHARLLMLGSFPPKPERWSMNFYCPNFINDMWRIIGLVFFNNKEYFILPGKKRFDEAKCRSFCEEKGIAIGDTADEVIRLKDNASDKFLEVVTPFDATAILRQLPECRTITITGQKAMDTFRAVIPADEPEVGGFVEFGFSGRTFRLFRMPSSSRAYPKSLEEKAAAYRTMFAETGLIR